MTQMRLRLFAVSFALLAAALFAPAVSAQLPSLDPNFSFQSPKVTVTLSGPTDPVNVRGGSALPVNVSIEIPGPAAEGKLTVVLNATAPEGWRAIVYPPTLEIPFPTSHTAQVVYAPVYFAVDPADDAEAYKAQKIVLDVVANTSAVAKGSGKGEVEITPAFGGNLRVKAPVAPVSLKQGAAAVPVDFDATMNAAGKLSVVAKELPKGCTLAP
ncbi:MAG TPA: hypothetical protein VNZ52_09800, partial [Candidatus Thermoplasmatota archaeon]|nr:hypothetical protein [Candidatus Thermoplasmatota archaeon]